MAKIIILKSVVMKKKSKQLKAGEITIKSKLYSKDPIDLRHDSSGEDIAHSTSPTYLSRDLSHWSDIFTWRQYHHQIIMDSMTVTHIITRLLQLKQSFSLKRSRENKI